MECMKSVHALKNEEVIAAVNGRVLPATALPQSYAGMIDSESTSGETPLPSPSPFSPIAQSDNNNNNENSNPPGLVTELAQGRFIVHRRGLGSEKWHSLLCDTMEEALKINPIDGKVEQYGTFNDVQEKLGGLREQGVTTLYLCGAMERDNGWGEGPGMGEVVSKTTSPLTSTTGGEAANKESGRDGGAFFYPGDESVGGEGDENASTAFELAITDSMLEGFAGLASLSLRPNANPFSVVDRVHPNRMLGGRVAFSRLVAAARESRINILVQLDPHVSASRPHRKYAHLYARILDATGREAVHAGCDSLENQWEDIHLLNYRLLETWECLCEEAVSLIQTYGLGGVYLTEAQSYPFIQRIDEIELGRKDPDGERHYTPRDIMEGRVVLTNREVGYWVRNPTPMRSSQHNPPPP